MTALVIEGLRASVGGREVLKGIDLVVQSGEVHALMGSDDSSASTLAHVIAGRPGFEATGGSVRLDDTELLTLPAWQRAEAGLFLAFREPAQVPGVTLRDLLRASVTTSDGAEEIDDRMRTEAARIGVDEALLAQPLNASQPVGEEWRNEMLQLAVLRPRFALLDAVDAGLDLDALRQMSSRIEAATNEDGLGVLVITPSGRLLGELRPDAVHVVADGCMQQSGGDELVSELQASFVDSVR